MCARSRDRGGVMAGRTFEAHRSSVRSRRLMTCVSSSARSRQVLYCSGRGRPRCPDTTGGAAPRGRHRGSPLAPVFDQDLQIATLRSPFHRRLQSTGDQPTARVHVGWLRRAQVSHRLIVAGNHDRASRLRLGHHQVGTTRVLREAGLHHAGAGRRANHCEAARSG